MKCNQPRPGFEHLDQIDCDKNRVVDWCIVLVEMPLSKFEECWPLPKDSLPELP